MKPGEGVNSYIGKEVVLRGEIAGTEDLFLDGHFEGIVNLEDSRLTIGPNAVIHANINSRDVVVLGSVHGNIVASGRVELRHTANFVGDLNSLHLVVEDGAVIMGRIDLNVAGRAVTRSEDRHAEPTLHGLYSDVQDKKEPRAEKSDLAVASIG